MNKWVIGIATSIHLIPHAFGVSPVGAAALYAGAHGRSHYSLLTPILILLVGNMIFGFYDPTVLAFVYAGFGLSALAGRWILSRKQNYPRYFVAISVGASLFYLMSNFAVWLVGYYPATTAGLVACYLNGLPYLGQALLVDAAFCFILFGLHHVLDRKGRFSTAAAST